MNIFANMQNLQKKTNNQTPTSTASPMQKDRNFPPLPHQAEFAVSKLKKKKVIQHEHVCIWAHLKSVA